MTTNLVPIQITLQAANAADAKQLVQDLAGTLSGMTDARIPSRTDVSAVEPAQPTPPAYPQQPFSPPVAPVTPPAPVAPPAQPLPGQVPTAAAPAYDLTQLGVAAQPILDAGRHAELIGWLQQHGAQTLTQLNPSLYGEFATYLRSLGAKI